MHELRTFHGENIAHVVVRCADHVRLQLGGKPAFVERQAGLEGLGLILDGQTQKMQDFIAYVRLSITALKDSQGNSSIATAPTLPQIWAKYGVSPDLDSAKAFATGVHRHNVEALRVILTLFEALLVQNSDALAKLKKSIPPVEADEEDVVPAEVDEEEFVPQAEAGEEDGDENVTST